MTREQRMYGLWSSPVSPQMLAATTRLGEPCWDAATGTLAWLEGRSDLGVIVLREADGSLRDLTPAGFSVRAQVGYGGGDFTLHDGVCYFVNASDQRIYRQPLAGGAPRAITPPFGSASTPAVSPGGEWVAYVHSFEDVDLIAIVDTEGRHWPGRLSAGRDFYMQPAWSPDGRSLAWVEWDHPNMPWDGTEIRLARLGCAPGALPMVADSAVIAGGRDVAVQQPVFTPDGLRLLYLSDETGMGQVYARDLASGTVTRFASTAGDLAGPAWNQGLKRFGVGPDGTVTCVEGILGVDSLVRFPPGGTTAQQAPVAGIGMILSIAASQADGTVAIVGSGGQQPPRVMMAAADGSWTRVVRRADGEVVPAAGLSNPEPVSWTSFDGEQAHGLYFPPASERFEGAGAPPVVVLIHGGPTSQTRAGWDGTAQFFATRGWAVLHVNYRGSTGYGRDYMLKLRESWGVYDVQDARTGVEELSSRGLADRTKAVIFGGSAGGYTVLQSLCEMPGFYRAAVCMFGVSNMFTLASDTHKFEARYLDTMIGPLPETAQRYRERSPIFHADQIVDPIQVFQGDIDRVVPREQSDSIVASLRARGVPHEYHVYEGEGHGWRKAETIDHFWKNVERFLRERVLYA